MISVLSQVAIFGSLPHDGLAALAQQGLQKSFAPGTQIMRQGDVSDTMYVITRGHVRVERSHPDMSEALMLAELGPGDVVGEMGLLDNEPRTATVTAIEETDTIELGAKAVGEILLRFPEVAAALLRMLSQRLRSTDELAIELHLRGDR